ncbi:MAG: G5 domain-containing protein [Clostridia bacterium]|nr:G5 domain-containing protein [Clostridia bacterium]MBQ7122923.1 G5 domain-containing protein [Clostridia bacterium]
MITNSVSANAGTRKKGFRFLTAFITVLFVCSVTVTTFAATNDFEVTVTDGEKSVSISAKTTDPRDIVKQAGFTLGANDELDLSAYTAGKGGEIVIERANIIRIEDSGIISYFVGYGDTLGDIFSKEGITLGEDDEINADPSKNIFDDMRVFIKRAFGVSVESDGESQKVFMAKGTVGDAIEKSGISVSKDDIVVPSLDTPVNGLTKIKIFRVKYDTKLEKQPVEYDTEVIYSDDMYIDEKEVVTSGVEGEKTVFYTAKYVDGELDEMIFEKEKVTKKPVNEVVKVGTKKRATLSSHKNNQAPISDLAVPADLKLDKNGIPVDYAYCVEGKATAYTGDPETASGRKPMPGHIAVDPKEFPYGTELYVVSADGKYIYGYCVAADTGGFVKMGNTDIDLYMDNEDMCYDWGNRNVKIYVLN